MTTGKAPLPDEVEKALKRLLDRANFACTPDKIKQRSKLNSALVETIRAHITAQTEKIAKLEASNKRLREALLFYANGRHMSEHGVDEPPDWVTWDYENGGSIETGAVAKAALAQEVGE